MNLALLAIHFGPPSYLVKAAQGSMVRKKMFWMSSGLICTSICLGVTVDLSGGQAKYKHFNLSGKKLDSLAPFHLGCLCKQG